MSENERPYIQIPVPPPEWVEYQHRLKEEERRKKAQEEEKTLDIDGNVVIIDI